jgi:hypothetical protein
MDIVRATAKYEDWLREHIPLLRVDLDRKHALMAAGEFPFLRATFYRWAQTWPRVSPKTAAAPEVLGVGDLHVENFGTWRDIEGRLIWGINDFDETCWLPYTCDLVRLAVSAYLAIAGNHLLISPERASNAILEGYRAGLEQGGEAFALAEHHPALRHMAVERLKQPEVFFQKLNALPSCREKLPDSARKALWRMLPDHDLTCRVAHRVSGLGSLGRRRYVALTTWRGGTIAREAKELAPSAWLWARAQDKASNGKADGTGHVATKLLYQEALDRSRRAPDPFVKMRGRWIVRRLAPDCSRIELASLPAKHDAVRLLHAMGFETANVHLGSVKARVILADLAKRPPGWLHEAALAMVRSVREDWNEWRKRSAKRIELTAAQKKKKR